jgi:SNF2 family DNA or RNA helicase
MPPLRDLRPLWNDFTYKDHQITGINWMLQREAEKEDVARGGILCDEMGLGKTIQMVGLIRNAPRTAPREQNLLVAPVAVLEQWKVVVRRSGLTVAVPRRWAGSWEIQGEVTSQLAPHVCVVGYEMVTRNPGLVRNFRWKRIIYDEAHRLAGESACGAIAADLHAEHKWLLTATPIVNDVADLGNLLRIIGIKGMPKTPSLERLRPLLPRYILSRTMDQLRASIPDAPPRPEFVSMSLPFASEEEADFYRGISGVIVRRWKALDADGMGAGAALEKLKLFMRLRQLSLHPQVYVQAMKNRLRKLYQRPDWEGSSTKFEAIRKLVCGETGKRWILFCHFRHEMELLRDLLGEEPSVGRVQLYNGGLSAAEKEGVIQRTHQPLEAGLSDVLLVQLQSGGVGLNLQHFNRIIFTGPWWTKALMEQAVGRAVRIGQREVVRVTHMRLKEEEALNIDAYMHEKADAKGALCREVLANSCTVVMPDELEEALVTGRFAAPARGGGAAMAVPVQIQYVDSDSDSEVGDPV